MLTWQQMDEKTVEKDFLLSNTWYNTYRKIYGVFMVLFICDQRRVTSKEAYKRLIYIMVFV